MMSFQGLDFVFIDELKVELTALFSPALHGKVSLLRACHLSLLPAVCPAVLGGARLGAGTLAHLVIPQFSEGETPDRS